MTKKLNEENIINELHGESAFFQHPTSEMEDASQPPETENDQATAQPEKKSTSQLTKQSASQSTNPTTEQSTDKAIRETIDTSPILSRPKAFYITEQQVEDLDVLVKELAKKLQGRGDLKIDRSVAVRLIFELTRLTDEATVDKLAAHMTERLVSQLTGQLAGRPAS